MENISDPVRYSEAYRDSGWLWVKSGTREWKLFAKPYVPEQPEEEAPAAVEEQPVEEERDIEKELLSAVVGKLRSGYSEELARLRNVRDRMYGYFGPQSHMDVESAPGEGTRVSFTLDRASAESDGYLGSAESEDSDTEEQDTPAVPEPVEE